MRASTVIVTGATSGSDEEVDVGTLAGCFLGGSSDRVSGKIVAADGSGNSSFG